MTLLVVGATESALRQIRTLVPAGVRVVDGGASPDWIIVATARQRAEAINSHRLSPYRIVEMPEIATELNERKARDGIRANLAAMAGIGRVRHTPSRFGVAVAHLFVRRMVGTEPVGDFSPIDVALPADAVPIVDALAGVAGRIAAGARLDEILAALGRERIKRIVSHTVRFE
jgi:hypothetical protein